MPRNVALRPSVVLACSIAILFCSVVARAQTADSFNPGANQSVLGFAIQPDGKIVLGGGFTGLGGGTGTTTRNHIGRLNVDGTVDPTFNPGTNSLVQAVALQPDGKILIGGNFTSVGGGTGLTTPRNRIARLNADGTVDPGFNPGANGNVYAIVVQPDGKILVGGEFSTMGGGSPGTPRSRLARLNPDGSPDSFNPGASKLPAGASAIVYTMALQADGKVVVGGYFNGLGGGTGATVRNYIGRINADGTLDVGFDPGASSIGGVNALVIQADGRILVGGTFTGLGGGTGTTNRFNLGRIDASGVVDVGFNPGAEAQVLTLGLQADGKILAGGYFKWMGDAGGAGRSVRNYIGRMNVDGSVDGTFNPGADNIVTSTAIQADGAIVAAGSFLSVGGSKGNGVLTTRNGIARFATTDPAIQTLTLSGGGQAASTMNWARSGAGPEVSRVTFEFSFEGSFYSPFGSGARVAGGWQVTGTNLPNSRKLWVRARGYYGSGFQNGSGSIVESILIKEPTKTSGPGDFDGDGTADLALYRPSSGNWYIKQSTTNYSTYLSYQWGISTDVAVPGDYDGDGRADLALYRPSTGYWYVLLSSTNYTSFFAQAWGIAGDIPVPGDYDGDGKTDLGLYRPSTGYWYLLLSSTNYTTFFAQAWGINADVAVTGDYDGDGKADLGLYRPSTGYWYVLLSSTNYTTYLVQAWGIAGDIPVPGDYDGDGKSDMGLYRPSTGYWYILQSNSNFATYLAYQWGINGDQVLGGDYDGDGKADLALYRPSTGYWYVLLSSTNYTTYLAQQWGLSTDVPLLKRP